MPQQSEKPSQQENPTSEDDKPRGYDSPVNPFPRGLDLEKLVRDVQRDYPQLSREEIMKHL